MPNLSRTVKIVGALVAVAALSGGIAVAATPNPETKATPAAQRVNAPNVITQAGYVPLAPCRIVDTRLVGAAIAAGSSRAFDVAGSAAFDTQGGTVGGCNVPVGASAVALSVTTTQSAGVGYLTLYAHGSTRPTANQTSYTKDQNITTLVNAPVGLSDGRLDVFSSVATHVVIDVAGYYREPIAVSVGGDGAVLAKSGQVLSVTHNVTGYYDIAFSQNVRGCAVSALAVTSGLTVGASVFGDGTQVEVVVSTSNGRADFGFFVTVTC